MNTTVMPTIGDIEAAIAPLRLGIGASELHGSMTGFLCAGGQPGARGWLDALQLESADAALADTAREPLAALAAVTARDLSPEDPKLELLLPAADDGLEARALALVDWCRGFLGGFGLGGVEAGSLDSGMAAIVRDFADIAATVPDMGEQHEDQAALTELVDHVRFGTLLLNANLTVPEDATRQ